LDFSEFVDGAVPFAVVAGGVAVQQGESAGLRGFLEERQAGAGLGCPFA
jgi:hypothetical protein